MSTTETTRAVIERFHAAANRRDIDAMVACMTDDCVFENTSPAPDGERFVGSAAIRRFLDTMQAMPRIEFETEEMFAADERAVVRWLYRWTNEAGESGHVRGVEVYRVRDGKICEALAYVKG